MKKAKSYLLAVMLMASAVLAGCGGNADNDSSAGDSAQDGQETEAPAEDSGSETEDSSDEQITLKLFHNWINVDEAPYFEDIAAEFEASHPNVKIEIENVGDPDYKSKLKVMLGAEDAPDIFFSWSGEYAQKFVRAGSVLDLTQYYDEDSQWKDSFIPASLSPFESDGKIYGVPVRPASLSV